MYEIKYRNIDEMKSSYIEWIGKIPIDWSIQRLRYLASIDTGNKDTQDRDDDGLYPFYVRSDTVERINSYSYEGEAILTAGDGVGVGRVFHYVDGKFAYHQRVYKLSEFKNSCCKYLYYYVSENFHKEVMKLSAKSTVDSLRRPMFSNFPVVLPGFGLQQKIANFLDIKTAQFDKIISKKEKLIEKLGEAKKSLISEVVTGKVKIVDGQLVERDASEMKESGVEWLGIIPTKWNTKKMKFLLKNDSDRIKIGPFGSALKLQDMVEGAKYKVYGQENLIKESFTLGHRYIDERKFKAMQQYELVHGDIAISMMGTIGKSKVIPKGIQRGIMDSHLLRIRLNGSEVNREYINLIMREAQFIKEQLRYWSNGSIMSGLNSSIVKNVVLPIPQIDEQNTILEMLLIKIDEVNFILESTTTQIGKLKQAKQSLISEAVTGKIDLRDWEIIEEGEIQ